VKNQCGGDNIQGKGDVIMS